MFVVILYSISAILFIYGLSLKIDSKIFDFHIYLAKLTKKSLFKAPINIGKNGKPLIIGKRLEDLQYEEVFTKNFGNNVYQHLKIK